MAHDDSMTTTAGVLQTESQRHEATLVALMLPVIGPGDSP